MNKLRGLLMQLLKLFYYVLNNLLPKQLMSMCMCNLCITTIPYSSKSVQSVT